MTQCGQRIRATTTALLAAATIVATLAGAPQSARAAEDGALPPPSAALCEKACAHKLALSTGHMGKGDRELPPEVARMLEDLPRKCRAACTAGRLDPECLLRSKAIQQAGVCEYYVWVEPEPAVEGPDGRKRPAPKAVAAESVDALAMALRKAILEEDEDAFAARFMPMEALVGCPNGMFGGKTPAQLRSMRAQTLRQMKGLLGQFDVIHEKAIVSEKDAAPVEDGTYWTHYGLDPLPSCAIKGQLVARMPGQRKDEKMGNLAILAVKVGKEWYHLGVGFAGW